MVTRPGRTKYVDIFGSCTEVFNCARLAGLVLSFIACFILLVIARLVRTFMFRWDSAHGDLCISALTYLLRGTTRMNVDEEIEKVLETPYRRMIICSSVDSQGRP